jgi:3-mercaptopyruvate sulfurtransferase SseA
MRFISSLSMLTVIAALAFAACNSAEQKTKNTGPVAAVSPAAPAAPAATSDGVRRVTPQELKAMLDKNEAVVIDVRNEASYNAAHVKGAKLIPEAEILKRVDELPRNKTIITYCS